MGVIACKEALFECSPLEKVNLKKFVTELQKSIYVFERLKMSEL